MKTKMHLVLAALVLSALFATTVCAGEANATVDAGPPQQQQAINPVEAFNFMAAQAEKGEKSAMLTLGTFYERGIGTARNFTKAFEWYGRAAQADLAEGYFNLGVCYEIGIGNSGDMAKAFDNFEKAAAKGLPQGLYKLASLYFAGINVEKNEAWGVELLGRAAAAGEPRAANDLGLINFEGLYGQPKDSAKAFDWFSRSAEMGYGEAMKNLAVFYRDGIGRPKDPAQELKWYALARLGGYPAGPLNAAIEQVKSGMTEAQVQAVEDEARAWVEDFQRRNAPPTQG